MLYLHGASSWWFACLDTTIGSAGKEDGTIGTDPVSGL